MRIDALDLDVPNPDLFLRFFLLFSRLEAVWKFDSNFYDWERQRPKLKAVAEKLKSLGLTYKEMISASEDVRYLDQEPPRVQVGPDNWNDYTVPPHCQNDELAILLDKVRVVRNNVFHGGKWCSYAANPTRDIRLISGAIIVIEQALKRNDDWNKKMPLK